MRKFILLVFALVLTACTLPTPAKAPVVDPAQDLMGTVVAATFEAMTKNPPQATATATPAATDTPPATPTPNTVKVSGKVCYQNKGMVQINLYFQADGSGKVLTQSVSRPAETYSIDLPPGKYKIYGWPPDYTMGVLVKDHAALDVTNSKPVTNLDFCDYSKGPFAVPYPPGITASQAKGSIAGTISGYGGSSQLTVVAFNQANGYWYYFILLLNQTEFSIPDLPAGRYQVVVYDETGITGGTDTNVYVVAGQRTVVTISNWGGGFPAKPEIK